MAPFDPGKKKNPHNAGKRVRGSLQIKKRAGVYFKSFSGCKVGLKKM